MKPRALARGNHYEEMTLRHEDFHSFAEFFHMDVKIDVAKSVEYIITQIRQGETKPGSIESNINLLLNYGHEELLAELSASGLITYGGLFQTFGRILDGKGEQLGKAVQNERLEHSVDLLLDPRIKRIKGMVDVNRASEFIEEMYKRTREKAPKRETDLYMAFALFPPSKWRHIRRLVNSWTEQAA